MNEFLITGCIISIIYTLVRVLETRMSGDDPKPLKVLVKDTILVYICSILGIFVFNQLSPLATGKSPTTAFTGNPEF
tara:strand:+ start:1760 stop:1990 length:231 start_codon:yes stop_codon:yes gene_type:complete